MKDKIGFCLGFLLFVSASLFGAEITIVGPSAPVMPGAYTILQVRGVDDADLAKSIVEVSPPESVTIFPAKTWGGAPIVIFSATVPGKYELVVSVNRTIDKLVKVTGEVEASQIDKTLMTELKVTVGKIGAKYPSKAGSCVVEVAGDPPVPPPPPPPPVPVTSGVVWTLIIRTVGTLTPDQTEVLANLREWSDQQPASKVAHFEFPPDAVGPDGSVDTKVAAFVKRIPPGKTQPYVFIAQANQSGKSVILWHGELPAKADDIVARIQEVSK